MTKIEIWSDERVTGTEVLETVTDKSQIRQMLDGLTLTCSVPYTRTGSCVSSWVQPGQMVQLYVKGKDGKEILCSGWLK